MVSPHERHTMVGRPSGTKGERAMVSGVCMCVSTETGGSATGLSATNARHGAAVGDDVYVILISAVARLSFSQKARNLDSINGGDIQKRRETRPCKLVARVSRAKCGIQ
jgi:hypothetical protein